jgi:hypothetical protein
MTDSSPFSYFNLSYYRLFFSRFRQLCGHRVPTILHKLPLTNGHNLAVIRAVTIHVCTYISFSCVATAELGPRPAPVEVSRSHTIRHTHAHLVWLLWTRDRLFAQAATYTAHNKHKRRPFMFSAGFEPVIPAIEWPQTYALDRAAITYTASSTGLPGYRLTMFFHQQ